LALWKQAVELAFARTIALSAIAIGLSWLACTGLGLAHSELASLGISGLVTLPIIAAFAFSLGAGLVWASPANGVSAAIAASLVLMMMFTATQIGVRAAQLPPGADGSMLILAASALAALVRDLALASMLYLIPLNAGSTLMHRRRCP
jgi:hypothetical protein